jgi:hypothetical protein
MRSLILTVYILLCLQLVCRAQDSLVLYKELTFSSPFEKQVLNDHFRHKKTDPFRLFMANGTLLKETAVYDAEKKFYGSLDTEKISSKRNDKKVKTIYDQIHDRFLSKYELMNKFEDIFYSGYYNCVSATALYGLAFTRLSIPFTIREKPTHVYLIAYPESERIMVETTSPVGGAITINQQFKQNYVATLKNQKLISADEYATKDVNELFDKHYFAAEENISLVQLVGIQYMNDGIFLLEKRMPLEALYQLEKAYLFYPMERMTYVMMGAAHDAFKNRTEKDEVHALLLAKLSRYKKYGITAEMIYGEFARVVQDLLFEKGDKEKLKRYFDHLLASVSDPEIQKEITFIYHYEYGRFHYSQARFNECIPFYKQALQIKPRHHDLNNIFVSAIAQSVKSRTNREILTSLENYATEYPFLYENNIYNEMLGIAYLIEFDFNFRRGLLKEAEKFRTTFETFTKAHPGVTYDNFMIGQAYSAAAVYYFKNGQTSKAKSLIARGLELSPGNYELLTRKKMIE